MPASSSSVPAPTATSCRRRKGILDTRLTVHGRAAHAGRRAREGPQRDPRGGAHRRATCTPSTAAGRASRSTSAGSAAARDPTSSPSAATSRSTSASTTADGLDAVEAAVREVAAATEVPDTTVDARRHGRAGGRWRSSPAAAGSSSTPRRSPSGSGSRSTTPRPAARPTPTRPPGWASRRSTASGRSAATTTRRRSTSRSTRSCRGRRCWPGCCWPSPATRRSSPGGRTTRGSPGDAGRVSGGAGRAAVSSGGPWEAVAGYSRAIVVGDACWVAGTTDAGPDGVSQHPGDIAGQARAVLRDHRAGAREGGFAPGRRRPDPDVRHRHGRRGALSRSTARSSATSARRPRWSPWPA